MIASKGTARGLSYNGLSVSEGEVNPMQAKINKIVLVILLMCFALVSCDDRSTCDMLMVAGGSQICKEQRK
jgi:hypothetical protein